MWIAGGAFSWYDVFIIISSNYCWTWRFAHIVEFTTFTITVPACPFNWIFLYVFHFYIFKQIFIKRLSNKPRVLN